jgi:hypothetical protein
MYGNGITALRYGGVPTFTSTAISENNTGPNTSIQYSAGFVNVDTRLTHIQLYGANGNINRGLFTLRGICF